MAQQRLEGQGITIPHSVGFIWTSSQPAEQNSTNSKSLTKYRHPSHRPPTPPAEFEPAIPASERSQIHRLDGATSGVGTIDGGVNMNNSRCCKRIYPATDLRPTCFSRGRERIQLWSLRVTVNENWHPRYTVQCFSFMYGRYRPGPDLKPVSYTTILRLYR